MNTSMPGSVALVSARAADPFAALTVLVGPCAANGLPRRRRSEKSAGTGTLVYPASPEVADRPTYPAIWDGLSRSTSKLW